MSLEKIIFTMFFLFSFLFAKAQPEYQYPTNDNIIKRETRLRLPPKNSDIKKPPTQKEPSKENINKLDKSTKNVSYVHIENADSWLYDKDINSEAQVLVGNVAFSHDGVYLYCDSAYFYEKTNSFDAYSNVLIQQGDTLFLHGDVLYYDGNKKLARMRGNVLMDNLTATLRTDSLNYDRAKNIGYYFNGGVIEDSLNTLESETGHYYPATKTAVFRHKVKLTNNKFVMNSDTLRYNTTSKIASILGPTTILYEKDTKIYSEYGWYNTENEQSKLLLNSYIEHIEGKRLEADTIFYDKKIGKGEGFKNVHLIDIQKKISLNGNYGYYIEKGERGVVTDSALMLEYSSLDTLFLHSDTLKTYAKKYEEDTIVKILVEKVLSDTIMTNTKDTAKTLPKDSVYKIFEGYHNVRFYRSNIQGVCDSSFFDTRDSVLVLLQKPIVWSEQRQLTGDTIKVFQKGEKIDRIIVNHKAFATDSVEKQYFNQVSGKQIVAHIKNDSLRRIDILGNVKSIYFLTDNKDSSIMGMATSESSIMNIYLKDNQQLDRIVIKPSPTGNIIPIDKIEENSIYLENYSWQIALRPTSKKDIFRKTDNIATISEAVVEDKKTGGKKTTRKQEIKTKDNQTDNKSPTTSTSAQRPSGFNINNQTTIK